MKTLFLIGFTFFVALTTALAQSGTVRKMKGKSAIIRFDERPDFKKGDRVSLADEFSNEGLSGAGSRDYSLSLSGTIESSTVDSGLTETDVDLIELSSVFMLNKEQFEFGGGLIYASSDTDGTDVTQYSFIGVAEYNFIANRPGVQFVPAVQGLMGISNYSSGSASGNGLVYGLSGIIKMFPWNDSFAITGALGFSSSSVDIGGGIQLDTTATALAAGIKGYF